MECPSMGLLEDIVSDEALKTATHTTAYHIVGTNGALNCNVRVFQPHYHWY
jgi:hypothetical protein